MEDRLFVLSFSEMLASYFLNTFEVYSQDSLATINNA